MYNGKQKFTKAQRIFVVQFILAVCQQTAAWSVEPTWNLTPTNAGPWKRLDRLLAFFMPN